MILVGGATRLTDSGLSITEWKPIMGALPPLNDQDWADAFAKYKQIPEYKLINKGMSLAAFKTIFWWEWGHRFLGRIIGFAFFIPFVLFWWQGRFPGGLLRRLAVIFVLGGLQGALGWYMVMSGLVDRVDVSQYRLAAHLGLAVALMGWIFWIACDPERSNAARRRKGVGLAGLVAGLIFVQILAGALVAGLDAGQGYNTWPLMKQALIPDGLWVGEPVLLNLFENALTVQFNHRVLAYVIVIAVALMAWRDLARATRAARVSAIILFWLALAQVALGIWTLLAKAPFALSLGHQALAMVLFLACLWHMSNLALRSGER
jgi:cytochrome c oxidase assembly protein subunit 15